MSRTRSFPHLLHHTKNNPASSIVQKKLVEDKDRDRNRGGGDRDRDIWKGDRAEWKGDRDDDGTERHVMREQRGVRAGTGSKEDSNKDVGEKEEGDVRDDQIKGERERGLEGEEEGRDEEEEGKEEEEGEGEGKVEDEGDIECSQWAASQIIEVLYVTIHTPQ